MKKNILLTLDYPPNHGGVARYLEALVKTFGGSFSVWSSVSGNAEVEYVELISSQGWPKWFPALKTVWGRRSGIKTLWVSHVLPLGTVAWIVNRCTALPYWVILHGLDFELATRGRWKRWLTRKIVSSAEGVLCNTNDLAQRVDGFTTPRQLCVAHPPLPVSMRALFEIDRSDRQKEDIRLLTVARLVSRKQQEAVIRALQTVPGVTYHIVGSGPEEQHLVELVQTLGLTDRVRIDTQVDDQALLQAYRESDIFVLPVLPDPVDREGFGIVYLEAAAAGLPIVATDLPGVREALSREGSIQLKEPTVEAIATALHELCLDKGRRKEMGEVNRLFARSFVSSFSSIKPYVD